MTNPYDAFSTAVGPSEDSYDSISTPVVSQNWQATETQESLQQRGLASLTKEQEAKAKDPLASFVSGVADIVPFKNEIAARSMAIGESLGRGDFGTAANQVGGAIMAPVDLLGEKIGWNQFLRSTGLNPNASANRSFAATTTPYEADLRRQMRAIDEATDWRYRLAGGAASALGTAAITGGASAPTSVAQLSRLTGIAPTAVNALSAAERATLGARAAANAATAQRAQSGVLGALGRVAPQTQAGSSITGRAANAAVAAAPVGYLYGYGAGIGNERDASAIRSAALGGIMSGGGQAIGSALNARAGWAENLMSPAISRSVYGGLGGASLGGALGYASSGGDANTAIDWAGAGLGLGAGAPALKQLAAPLGRVAERIDSVLPRINPTNSTGMFGGNVFAQGPSKPLPRLDYEGRMMEQLAARSGMSPEELTRQIQQAQSNQLGATFADVLGDSAIQRASTLSRLPGQTRELAIGRSEERIGGALDRLMTRLSGAGPDQDPMSVLNQNVAKVSEDTLTNFFKNTPYQLQQANEALSRLMGRRQVREAVEEADALMADMVSAGMLKPESTQNPLMRMHYAKIVLQAQGRDPNLLRNSASKIDNGLLASAEQAVKSALDSATRRRRTKDNYTEAMKPIQDAIAPRTVAEALMTAQRTDMSNVAGNALSMPHIRRLVDRQGYTELGDLLRASNQLDRNARRMDPRTGSQTFGLGQDALDQAANEPGRLLANLGNLPALAARGLGFVTSPMREGYRNQLGRALYEPIDPGINGYNEARVQGLLAALRRARAEKDQWTKEATRNAALGAMVAQ